MSPAIFTRIVPLCALGIVAACSSNIAFAPEDSVNPLDRGPKETRDAGLGGGGWGGSSPDASLDDSDIKPVFPPMDDRSDDDAGRAPGEGPGAIPPACPDDDEDGRCNDVDRCDGRRVALDKGPLFYFAFDEAPGATVAQNLGSVSVSGQYVGPVTLGVGGVADPRASALRIPGESATFPRVAVLNVPAFPSTALSAMFWVKTSQTSQYAVISYALADSANEFSVFVDIDLIRIDLEDLTFEQDLAVSTRITDGTWHFVAVTWADQIAQLYFDGEAVGTPMNTVLANAATRFPTPDPGAAIDLTSGGTLIFGQDQDSLNAGFATNQALNGGLDEVAIFDRALGPDEIRDVFQSTTCGERCDGLDNDADGTVDEGFQGSSPSCPAPSCQSIGASGSAFITGTYFLQADPNAPITCVF
jgi:hypothetical protein